MPSLSLLSLAASLKASVYDCLTEGGIHGENKYIRTGKKMCGFKNDLSHKRVAFYLPSINIYIFLNGTQDLNL